MADFNKLILQGRAVADPEERSSRDGSTIANFRLASNRRSGDAIFIKVSVFGKRAETILKYLTKGKPIICEGRLDIDQWEDKSGNKQSAPVMICSDFNFVDMPKDQPLTQAQNGGKDFAPEDIDDSKEISLEDIPF